MPQARRVAPEPLPPGLEGGFMLVTWLQKGLRQEEMAMGTSPQETLAVLTLTLQFQMLRPEGRAGLQQSWARSPGGRGVSAAP